MEDMLGSLGHNTISKLIDPSFFFQFFLLQLYRLFGGFYLGIGKNRQPKLSNFYCKRIIIKMIFFSCDRNV